MKNVKELRTLLDRERRAQPNGKRLRFSPELRKRVTTYVSQARARHVPESQLLAQLGLSEATLIRWCGRRGNAGAFRQVGMVRGTRATVVTAEPVVAMLQPNTRHIPVAIVGMSVADLVELCRGLGC
jgi:hypothetical protein